MSNELTQIQNVSLALNKIDFKSLLPMHINEEKFKQVAITAIQKNPKLLTMNRASFFSSCQECARDGLIPDGRESALIPYKGKVKYTPMVNGITKMARNSGEILTIDAVVVYENDEYDAWTDEKGAHFKHKKCRKDRGIPITTYAYAITKDGGFYFEEIDEEQMAAIEACSPANDSPWKGSFKDEMRRKSALRRLCKYRLPSSSDIDSVIRRDDEFYELEEDNKQEPDSSKTDETDKQNEKKSKLEEVVEAEFKEENEQEEIENENTKEEQAIETNEDKLSIIGVVDDVKCKSGETNGKKWIKYGFRIDGNYYGTFSKTIREIAIKSKEENLKIKVEYETADVNGVIYRNVLNADLDKWEEEINNEENSDIPI